MLRSPEALAALLRDHGTALYREAARARLHAWLAGEIETRQLEDRLDPAVRRWIQSSRAIGAEFERAIRWEVNRLRRALEHLAVPVVLLKGAAYVCADLPLARGRLVADIDILVPEERLAEVEAAVRAHGWIVEELEAYDVRYYRRWMHELPPMRHEQRRAQLDVHHAILPRTSRLHADAARLLGRSIPLEAYGVRVLCPSHMVLHTATHLFHDGEVAGGLREVFDLHRLFMYFGDRPAFWDDFLAEAAALELTRPAYYAVRYAHSLCGTPVPDRVREHMRAWGPPSLIGVLMDRLVAGALEGEGFPEGLACWALFVRAHWLRMPPLLLARHLAVKAWRRTGLAF